MKKATKTATQKAVSNKIKEVVAKGVRKNTKAPVSKDNPRRKVPLKQAVAIAESQARKGKAKNG